HRADRHSRILPFISQDAEWRGKEWVVAKLIYTNLCCNHRHSRHIAKPIGFGSVQQVDQRTIKTPHRNRKQKIPQILATDSTPLKKDNEKYFWKNRSRSNRRDQDKSQPVGALEFG